MTFQQQISSFQELGRQVSFGGLAVRLCAMPRQRCRAGRVAYSNQNTVVPQGERFYPYKLGYKFLHIEPYASIHDLYRFLEWQMIYEKQVRFLDRNGRIRKVKPNNRWKQRHLDPIKEILQLAKTNHQIDAHNLLEAQ